MSVRPEKPARKMTVPTSWPVRHELLPNSLIMPRLGCGRYTLGGWEHTDADVLREAAGDPCTPAITTVPALFDPAAAAAYIERQKDRPRTGEEHSFVVIDDGVRAVGSIGLCARPVERAAQHR